MMARNQEITKDIDDYGALYNVAEDLKTPLVRILTLLELQKSASAVDYDTLETITKTALNLVDSYVLSSKIYTNQTELNLSPVSIKAVLYESTNQLKNFAKIQKTTLNLDIQKNVGLAMANYNATLMALVSLAYSFLQNNNDSPGSKLIFSLKKGSQDISVGVFCEGLAINQGDLNKLRGLSGVASQLMPDLAHGSSAGILLADRIFAGMNTELRATKLNKLSGLVAKLVPSRQLKLL